MTIFNSLAATSINSAQAHKIGVKRFYLAQEPVRLSNIKTADKAKKTIVPEKYSALTLHSWFGKSSDQE